MVASIERFREVHYSIYTLCDLYATGVLVSRVVCLCVYPVVHYAT